MNVEPITPSERRRCAYCDKPLQPAYACRKTFYGCTVEAKGRTPEQQLAEYKTNRRIVRIARKYHQPMDYAGNKTGPRQTSSLEVVHFPDGDEWGLWGTFCGQLCAARFGYASHRAGYRLKGKT
jgi:hypothetical protein